jgi:RNA polymerase sigma-70 factor (ECF subfamily)
MMAPESDDELVERLRRKDVRAFDIAYARYAPRLYRFLLRLCRSRAAAEDVLQETWLKLSSRASELSAETDLSAWLFTVARNAWISRARVERRVVEFGGSHDRADGAANPEARAVSASSVAAVERALMVLAETDREILLLVGVEEMSHAAAAQVLGVSDVVFRQRLHRARERLTSELEQRPRVASGDRTDE